MIENLALATAMVELTVIIHFTGLLLLMHMLRMRGHHFRVRESTIGQGVLIVMVVLGIFAIHTAEIWAYAFVFQAIGAIEGFEQALYFSTVNFTTLGYGDIVLSEHWRLFAAIEGANGLLLIGWSTAFLLAVTARMRTLEHDWLDKDQS
jgi:voltage-gated potassium channel Kch